jgi:hypothetical protein
MKPLLLPVFLALLFSLAGCVNPVSPNGDDTTDEDQEERIWIEHSEAFLFTQYHYANVVPGAWQYTDQLADWIETTYMTGDYPLSTRASTYVPDPNEDNEGISTATLEDFLADHVADRNWTRIMIFAVATSPDDPIFDHIDPILAGYPELAYIVIWVPGIGTDEFVEDAKEAIQSATF